MTAIKQYRLAIHDSIWLSMILITVISRPYSSSPSLIFNETVYWLQSVGYHKIIIAEHLNRITDRNWLASRDLHAFRCYPTVNMYSYRRTLIAHCQQTITLFCGCHTSQANRFSYVFSWITAVWITCISSASMQRYQAHCAQVLLVHSSFHSMSSICRIGLIEVQQNAVIRDGSPLLLPLLFLATHWTGSSIPHRWPLSGCYRNEAR